MKAFTSAQKKEHAAIVERLHATRGTLRDAIDAFNGKLTEEYGAVDRAREACQDAIDEANALLDDVRGDAQSHFDDRSEKWQEGDAGQQYQDWISELEQPLDRVEVDEPQPLIEPDLDGIETFEEIRQAVED